jgi:hypothetical protein
MPQAGGNLELSIGARRDAVRRRKFFRGARAQLTR